MQPLTLSVDTYGSAVIHGSEGRDTLVMLLKTAIEHKQNEMGQLGGYDESATLEAEAEAQIAQWEDGIYQIEGRNIR